MTVLAVLAHVGVIIACWLAPSGPRALFLLNAFIACAVLIMAASRARSILAGSDLPYVSFAVGELLVLAAAVFAFRGQPIAAVTSYFAFALHSLVALAAVVFAYAFKMRLM